MAEGDSGTSEQQGFGAGDNVGSYEKPCLDSPTASKVLQVENARKKNDGGNTLRLLATTSFGLVDDEVRRRTCMYGICHTASRAHLPPRANTIGL